VTGIDRDQLRLLVREVVREAVRDLQPKASPATPPVAPIPDGPIPTGRLAAEEKSRTDCVRIGSDQELDTFVRHLLKLFENPKTRADLRQGRLTFRLAAARTGGGGVRRIERGAVTERQVAELAATGATLVLGPKAVLTPLGRERARALGVTVEKERS
jgi:hypothetical protein